MNIEISVEEFVGQIVVSELSQSLDWFRKDLASYDTVVSKNVDETEHEKEELRKDIYALERVLSYYRPYVE